jgi:rubredoxin
MANYTKYYLCHSCGFEYEDRHDAQNCCPAEFHYKCNLCDLTFGDADKAVNHFENEHYSFFEEATQIELEKAGQQRLFSSN